MRLGRSEHEALLFDVSSRVLLELNHSAAEIWLRLDGRPVADLVAELASTYRVDATVVEADFETAITHFAANGLLAPFTAAPATPAPDSRAEPDPGPERRWAERWSELQTVASTTSTSGPYRVGPETMQVVTNDDALRTELDRVLRPLRAPGPGAGARRLFAVERRHGWVVSVDGAEPTRVATRIDALTHALWHVNQLATAPRADRLSMHAAAVEIDGRVLVLPGVSNAGKSTLVTGLVAAGARYLTDEAALLDRNDLVVDPFPKAIALDPGSFSLFPELKPSVGPAFVAHLRRKWHVDPAAVGSVGTGGPVAAVVAPCYERGAPTQLQSLSFGPAVELLLGATFTGTLADFDTVVAMANRVPVRKLSGGDLHAAVAAVFELAAGL
ncbi:MAG: PqqD family peptide modification chaperone [Acidimicrobiales bacterium]|nr:PqqD family peptide modification chaperone [Acidimicrobiales bacterium]